MERLGKAYHIPPEGNWITFPSGGRPQEKQRIMHMPYDVYPMKRQYYAVLAGLQKIGLAVVAIVASGSAPRICPSLQAKFLQERAEEGKTLA